MLLLATRKKSAETLSLRHLRQGFHLLFQICTKESKERLTICGKMILAWRQEKRTLRWTWLKIVADWAYMRSKDLAEHSPHALFPTFSYGAQRGWKVKDSLSSSLSCSRVFGADHTTFRCRSWVLLAVTDQSFKEEIWNFGSHCNHWMPLILATTQVLRVSLRQICVKSAKSKLLKFTARFQPFSESRPFEVQFHPSASQEVGVKNVHRCTHLKPFQLVWTRLNLFLCCPPPRYIRKTCERRFASCDQPIPEAQKRSKIWCLSRTPFPLFSVYVFQCVHISSKFQSALTIDHLRPSSTSDWVPPFS